MANTGIEIMRRIMSGIAFVLPIALPSLAETVTNVRGSQRENSKLVDIYYDLNAAEGCTYTIEVSIEGRTKEVLATTFSGDAGAGIAPGKNRHIVWEAGADWRGKTGDVKAVVIASMEDKYNKVQLWAGGPYWADRNIGASAPWKYGRYFWWGDTVGHTSSYCFYPEITQTMYKSIDTLKSEGWITTDGVLAPSHDAAHVKWGGGWRMPTKQEFDDLNSMCDWTWTTVNGVRGYVVRGRGNYTSGSIFFPAAGHSALKIHTGSGSVGYYWSSSPHSLSNFAYHLTFPPRSSSTDRTIRFIGEPVRPVQDFATTATVSGSSMWFFVDTTDGALKVADVRSDYFDGEYGGVGRKATFLSGVSCDIEMTILDDPVNVDHWLVNGREVTTRTFTFDVGSLPVGGRLEVVAVGKNDGVRSKPFRANFDVAAVPSAISWTRVYVKRYDLDEVVYATFPFPIELELAESREASISALDWLPQKTVKVAPKVSFDTEIKSSGNGLLRLAQVECSVDKSKTFLGTQARRPNGMFAEAAGVSLGFNFTGGPLTATWDSKEKQWMFHSVMFGIGISGKGETPPCYFTTPIGLVYGKFGAEANISARCEVSGLNLSGILGANLILSSEQFPALIMTCGYGINNKLNLEGAISAEFPIDVVCEGGDLTSLRYGVRGAGRITAKAFILKATLWQWHSPTIWFIDNTSPKSMRLMSSAPSTDIEWQLQSRDYLKKETPRMRLMAAALTVPSCDRLTLSETRK